jgi:MFS family permease
MASLFLSGHMSNWVGRRRMLVPALAVNVPSAVLFLAFPSLAGLVVARIVSGVSTGLTTGTATAYLGGLHLGADASQARTARADRGDGGQLRRDQGWAAGRWPARAVRVFAAGDPCTVFGGMLVVLTVLVAIAPETATMPDPRPDWHPQRVAIPRPCPRNVLRRDGGRGGVRGLRRLQLSCPVPRRHPPYPVAGAVAFSGRSRRERLPRFHWAGRASPRR